MRLSSPALALALLVPSWPALSQQRDEGPAGPATRLVVPGPHYRAGGLHRLIFGSHYRTLWTAPLPAEVIDLRTFSGGLTPRRKGGGRQTRSLKFEGADGREWKFRTLDKDPSAVLPPELRDTFVDAIVQDQISAALPAGPLVVDALSRAAGILHVPHTLVVLPDDPLLGQFRQEFGGLLGFLEEEPQVKEPVTPGFESFSRLLDTVELWERLDAHPEEKVDERAYLKARLFDLFIGDFDRHKDQWQWVKARDSEFWQPVPEDRDQAFARYDGFALWLVRPSHPDLVDFGPEYPRIFGLTWSGRYLDRRHLGGLSWPEWEAVARELQSRLTDEVITAAVAELPPEHHRLGGSTLVRRLQGRRDGLPRAALRFYRQLAGEVEVHGTDQSEVVDVAPGEGGTVAVTITGSEGEPRYRRFFRPQHTSEVRLHLKGGDDRLVRQPGTGAITLRVIGGAGHDILDDTRAGGTRFYDADAGSRVLPGDGTRWDRRPYTPPNDSTGQPARDWGHSVLGTPLLSGGGDLGLFLGARVSLVRFGFRKHPYASSHSLRAGWATALSAAQAEYTGEVYRANSPTHGRLVLRASQIDILRFYGLGNQTSDAPGEDFFRVEQSHLMVAPSLHLRLRPFDVELGAVAAHSSTPMPADRFIGVAMPYGAGEFGQAGLRARVALGQRNLDGGASGAIWASGTYYPEVWSVESHFGAVEGQASAFLSAPDAALGPQLGVRAGGRKLFGRFPFHESAFVGGPDQVRGLRPQRYAGEASAFGSVELHLRLARVSVLLPSELGVLGFADVGRVWADGETSDRWHRGVGGGVWLAPLKRSTAVGVVVAKSQGAKRFYVQAGFGF